MLTRGGVLQGRRQRALVAVLVVELVVPLEDELARPEWLRGGLGGWLEDWLGLAELAGEVGGAGRLGGPRGGGAQGGVVAREPGGGGLEALTGHLRAASGGEHFVKRRASGQEGPRRGRRRGDDGVVWLEGHPAAGDVLRREAHRRERVGELDRRGNQRL